VRTDGSDTTCNGSLDLADSASVRPACAMATPQGALDRLPDVLFHNVTISIAAGTYRTGSAGIHALDVSKLAKGNVALIIKGSGAAGTTIISGATSGAPTVAAGSTGIFVTNALDNLYILNLTFDRFTDAGVRVARAAAALDGVSITNGAGTGLVVERGGTVTFVNTNTVSSNAGNGIVVTTASRVANNGTLTVNANGANGMYAEMASVFTTATSTSTTFGLNGASGILFTSGSTAGVLGNLTVTTGAGASHAILMNDRSGVGITGVLSITVGAAGTFGIIASLNSYASVVVNAGGTTITCTAALANTVAMGAQYNSSFFTGGTGDFKVITCDTGINLTSHATFRDDNSATNSTKTFTSVTNVAKIDRISLYDRGRFGTNTSCGNNSTCP
jgi:hypothetical protein